MNYQLPIRQLLERTQTQTRRFFYTQFLNIRMHGRIYLNEYIILLTHSINISGISTEYIFHVHVLLEITSL